MIPLLREAQNIWKPIGLILISGYLKLNWNKIEVKVRIPEFPEGQAQLDAIWDKVVKKIYRMNNGVFTLSNYKNSDPNYYIVEGTRV